MLNCLPGAASPKQRFSWDDGDITVVHVFPCSLWRDHSGAGISCSPWRGPCWRRHPHCSLWRTPHHRRWMLPDGAVAHGEPMLQHVYPEELQPMGKPYGGAGKSVRRKQWQRSCHGLTTASHAPSSALLGGGGREVGNEGEKMKLGRKGWGGRKVLLWFRFCLCFSPSISILIRKKLIFPCCLFHLWQ